MTGRLAPIETTNGHGLCAQCGAPLPVDVAGAICPACELRGALSIASEGSQFESIHGDTANDAAGSQPAARSEPDNGAGVLCGRRFSDYELLEEIARGGMGVVFQLGR